MSQAVLWWGYPAIQKPATDKNCRLRRSTQHLLGAYSLGFGILRFFWGVDSSAARPGRAALERWRTGRFLAGSIAAGRIASGRLLPVYGIPRQLLLQIRLSVYGLEDCGYQRPRQTC